MADNNTTAGGPEDEISALETRLATYGRHVAELLNETPWAFWKPSFWTYWHWVRRDPELRKILARLYAVTDDLLRCVRLAQATSGSLLGTHVRRIAFQLEHQPARLTLESAIEVFDALDRILIEIGDERFVCEEILGELQWAKGSTTWTTWDSMYGAVRPKAVEAFLAGTPVNGNQLAAARNQLAGFRRARSDDYQVHRARLKMRAKNLDILGSVLLPLVVGMGWFLAMHDTATSSLGDIALIAVSGALGAAISGTIKARDKLVRGSDLRAFRSGLVAQLLIGAGSALLLYVVVKSGLAKFAGTDSLEGLAALGFIAGFSEPFFLKTVERVAKMGEETADRGTSKGGKENQAAS